jgi:PAS domain S-box-containing protein
MTDGTPPQAHGNGPSWRYWARVGALFAAYFVTGKIGLSLDAVSGFATLVWPPTGIALAALLLGGRGLWPGVALGAFFVNLTTGAAIPVAAGIAAGNTLEAVAGVWLLRRVGFQSPLERLRDVVALVVLAGLLSTAISATVGPLSLLAGGVIGPPAYGPTAWAWWVGDALSDVLVAPFLLVWLARPGARVDPRRALEAAILGLTLAAVGVAVFGGALAGLFMGAPVAYLVFPPLVWAALRFGQRGATAASLGLSLLAVQATARGTGPFAMERLSDSLAFLEMFMGIVGSSAMVLAAVDAQRARAEREVRESEEQYRLLTQTAPDAILTIDDRSTIRFANAAAENLFGRAAGEMVGGPLTALMPERFRETHRASLKRYVETGQRHIPWSGVELTALHKDGREIPIEVSFAEHVVKGERRFTGVIRDLTERKRAEKAKAELREFLKE